MHQYLDAIGFKNTFTRESEIERMLDNLSQSFDSRQAAREEVPGCAFLEMSKSCGPGMGIRLCGQMDSEGFHRTYYYPYLERSRPSLSEEVSVEMRGNGEGYSGQMDDGRAGMSIVFFVQNPAQLKKNRHTAMLTQAKLPVVLTGLSTDGMILLGHKPLKAGEKDLRREDDRERSSLVSAAKKGSEDAVQSLTMEDMDTFAMLARRITTEDIYTIVESSLMPAGMECDQYRILGTILFYTKVQNSLTRQYVYQMTLDCNGIPIDICINQKDLTGEPEAGRRFKGSIWLQGRLVTDPPAQQEAEPEKTAVKITNKDHE